MAFHYYGMVENLSAEGRKIKRIRKYMRRQFTPERACKITKGNCTTLRSKINNEGTVRMGRHSSVRTANIGLRRYTVGKLLRAVSTGTAITNNHRSNFKVNTQSSKSESKFRGDVISITLLEE